jgi:nudix-type nucleoside diphosphatase (YffH/AdpP family)
MSGKAVIERRRRLFDDVFKIDEFLVAHAQADGAIGAGQRRLVFERGDSVAILLLDRQRGSVVLVEQFRMPVLVARRRDDPSTTDGWIIETIAGTIDAGETPDNAVVREAFEETGYRIQRPRLIGRVFSSPGGASERVFLYFAEVTDAQRLGQGGGVDGEDIRITQLPLEALFDRLAGGLIEDSKLVIAAYWLQDQLRSRHED